MSTNASSRIFYTKPSITDREVGYATDAATTGWGERCYEYIGRFEREFAAYLGTRHAIATSSATGALHLGMAGLDIGPGDEVILCDSNWIASAAPIIHLGATPVLVDADPVSWCLDPAAVEAAITPRTKAILAVHLYGNLCDIDSLAAIAQRHGLALLEDAAEAIGSAWKGRKAGSMGRFGAFSFHGTKTLTTGEGGMFVTNDDTLYERVLTLSNHGRARGETRQFWPERVGFKYKMSNVQAAIGCAQLERVEELVAAKRRIFSGYREALDGLPLRMNPEPPGTVNGVWMPTIVVDDGIRFDRADLLARFKADNIDGRVFFWPLSALPPFEPRPGHAVSHRLSARGVNLPSYHDLGDAEIARVAGHVRRLLEAAT
ncbi:glutamine--scyllo-inositol aminotransferase [Arenimonas soli]|uniref:Glutamine--scyllo-inositol aminotransferase n=1 Tax=Arenimonas soli TaxID=2269504 RepID=A0ABQ1HRC7_9GAMM|nr:DegT/DnrJ/EryC1/StrS family aminotransferase [Arenimonas soli]GGA85071.1 glutamine--scyllo-inositol aminotransferase [Arenimonas soli]